MVNDFMLPFGGSLLALLPTSISALAPLRAFTHSLGMMMPSCSGALGLSASAALKCAPAKFRSEHRLSTPAAAARPTAVASNRPIARGFAHAVPARARECAENVPPAPEPMSEAGELSPSRFGASWHAPASRL